MAEKVTNDPAVQSFIVQVCQSSKSKVQEECSARVQTQVAKQVEIVCQLRALYDITQPPSAAISQCQTFLVSRLWSEPKELADRMPNLAAALTTGNYQLFTSSAAAYSNLDGLIREEARIQLLELDPPPPPPLPDVITLNCSYGDPDGCASEVAEFISKKGPSYTCMATPILGVKKGETYWTHPPSPFDPYPQQRYQSIPIRDAKGRIIGHYPPPSPLPQPIPEKRRLPDTSYTAAMVVVCNEKPKTEAK